MINVNKVAHSAAANENARMVAFATLDDFSPAGQTVLVRADLNVPVQDGLVTDTTRLARLIPTLKELADKGAKVVVLAHFGRPKGVDASQSLAPIAAALQNIIPNHPVSFVSECLGVTAQQAVHAATAGDIVVLENLRFHAGEEANDAEFAKQLASLGQLYVNDAFSVSHRAHASVEAITQFLPSYAGRNMQAELEALQAALEAPEAPVMAIAGGSKISTKLHVLRNLVSHVNVLVLGGAMANTFLAAQGLPIGSSMYEPDMLDAARDIAAIAETHGCQLVVPLDAQLAAAPMPGAAARIALISDIRADESILDYGPQSLAALQKLLGDMKTLLWNGPLGVFEVPPFDMATVGLAHTAVKLTQSGQLVTVAGGGDTAAAINHAGVFDDFTYVSTAGGAFLEWLEGKTLPGVAALSAAAQRQTKNSKQVA